MVKWQVLKLVKGNGNVPFDKWFDTLTQQDKAKVIAAIALIESVTTFPAEKVKKYRDLWELKIVGNGTALRPLAIRDDARRVLILLHGVTKKGEIPSRAYDASMTLAKAHRNESEYEKGFWED
jgi:hypothetical protein